MTYHASYHLMARPIHPYLPPYSPDLFNRSASSTSESATLTSHPYLQPPLPHYSLVTSVCSFFRTFALLMFPLLRPSYLQTTTMFTSPPPSGLSSNVTFSVRLSLTSLKFTSIPSSSQPLSLLYICPSSPPQGISVCLLCCCISGIQIVPDTQVEVSKYLLNRFMTQVVAYIFKKKNFCSFGAEQTQK